jgi:uncharacterized protein (DUF433 family)
LLPAAQARASLSEVVALAGPARFRTGRSSHMGADDVSTEVTYPHIEKPADGPARLQSTPRVRVAQLVMDYLNYGWSVEEMCRQHPYLSRAEAHAAMAYYFDHRGEIHAEIETESKELEGASEHAATPIEIRLRAQGLL